MKRLQQGFGMIAAIVILVILASLASAMIAFGTAQQLTSAQDVMSVKAWQAAKAGNEWGMFMALNSGAGWNGGMACSPAAAVNVPGVQQSKDIDLKMELGFSVMVTCSATKFYEGELLGAPVPPPKEITLYTITSKASNGVSASSPGYVERTRAVIVAN